MTSFPDKVIARAVAVAGRAYAHDVSGELRVLGVGDQISDGETVVTPDGGRVELELIDGSLVRVDELSGRKIAREMISGNDSRGRLLSSDTATPPTETVALQFLDRLNGRAVRTAGGNSLFYNEMPLYWSLNSKRSAAFAVVPAGSCGLVADLIAFTLQLEDGPVCCALRVNDGIFSQETHHIPFTTGDPQPGLPVAFFGIAEGLRLHGTGAAGDSETVMSAEINTIGTSNNWYREGRDIVFEFLGKAPRLSAAEPPALAAADHSRAVNSFSFRNTGATPVLVVVRAYRGKGSLPVFEEGSAESPLEIISGGEYMAVSDHHYDRLVVSQLTSTTSSSLSLNLAGYSEFLPAAGAMSVPIAGMQAGQSKEGELRFSIDEAGRAAPEIHFPSGSAKPTAPLFFDSIWDRI